MSIIPKEKQTAYERWELSSFGDERPAAKQARQQAAQQVDVAALVDQQVEALREVAQREGFQAGFAAGQEEGRRLGYEQGRADADRHAAELRALALAFRNEVAGADEAMAEDLLTLALDLAKAMLKTSLQVRPELVLPVVGEAVRYLPTVQQPAILYLHPQDVELVREHMGDELAKAGWRIAEDMQLARGGCRVDTASNQVDASAQVRWQRIAEALGRSDDWLA